MKRIRRSEEKKQAIERLLTGKYDMDSVNILSEFIKLCTEKTLQELLEVEQDEFLGRDRYERGGTEGRRNGYEPGRFKTAEGILEVGKPQIRGLDKPYRSELWDKFTNTSEQLRKMVMEMYTLGMSTRDIEEGLENALGGFIISRNTVSKITEELSEEYEKFKQRDLSGFDVIYLFIDTVYEPLRRYGSKTGVMCSWAYLTNGSKVLIDITTANAESYEACVGFLRGMIKRGLRTPLTITTDGAVGLIQAIEAIWPKTKRIRCWFHKMQNLQAKVPDAAWEEFKSLVQDVRDAPDIEEGKARIKKIISEYHREFPEACRCLADDMEASLNHLTVPHRHRQYVRTTNLVERTFAEERRRTKTIPNLWDEKSLLKLVFATLIRVSDRWAQPSFSVKEEESIKILRNKLLKENEPIAVKRKPKKRRSHSRVA